jgi:hypothetical protein
MLVIWDLRKFFRRRYIKPIMLYKLYDGRYAMIWFVVNA